MGYNGNTKRVDNIVNSKICEQEVKGIINKFLRIVNYSKKAQWKK